MGGFSIRTKNEWFLAYRSIQNDTEIYASVKINTGDQIYIGEEFYYSRENYLRMEKLINSACAGKEKCLWIKNGNEIYFFPKEILQKSVITITKHKFE